MFNFISKLIGIFSNNKVNKSTHSINPVVPVLSEIKCLTEVDIYCDKIIEPNNENESSLIISARILLRSIVLYCVKENIHDFWKLADIVNSDTDLIINILSKYKDTEEGSIFIACKDRQSENIIRVLRHFVNNYQSTSNSSY